MQHRTRDSSIFHSECFWGNYELDNVGVWVVGNMRQAATISLLLVFPELGRLSLIKAGPELELGE